MKKNVILFIDTSTIDTVRIAIEVDGKRVEKVSESRILKSQQVLPLIEELLKAGGISLEHIEKIEVKEEGASFTGQRVGLSIANALGELLDIPVNGSRALALPKYSGLQWAK